MKQLLRSLLFSLPFLLMAFSTQAQHPGVSNDNDCLVFTPNAFTPNNDGVNDFFFFTFKDDCKPSEFNIQIMDRWGRMVFESKNHEEKWDGTFNGQELKQGAYLWVMRSKLPSEDNKETTIEKKGTLLLIK